MAHGTTRILVTVLLLLQNSQFHARSSFKFHTASSVIVPGEAPPTKPLEGASLTYVSEANSLVLFGGCYLDHECFNHVFIYNIETEKWANPLQNHNSAIAPEGRGGHCAILHESTLYIIAGSSMNHYLNDIWALDIRSWKWRHVEATAIPQGRQGHSCAWISPYFVVFGGYTRTGYSNKVLLFDPAMKSWTESVLPNSPAPRAGHSSAVHAESSRVVIVGGMDQAVTFSDVHVLDIRVMAWSKPLINEGVALPPVQLHASFIYRGDIYVFTGCDFHNRQCNRELFVLRGLFTSGDIGWNTLGRVSASDTGNTLEREGVAHAFVGSRLYFVGGCKLGNLCFNDFHILDVEGDIQLKHAKTHKKRRRRSQKSTSPAKIPAIPVDSRKKISEYHRFVSTADSDTNRSSAIGMPRSSESIHNSGLHDVLIALGFVVGVPAFLLGLIYLKDRFVPSQEVDVDALFT